VLKKRHVASCPSLSKYISVSTGKVCTVLAHHKGTTTVVHRYGVCCETAVRGGPIPLYHQTARATKHKSKPVEHHFEV